jgi:hypothetical protein
MATKKIGVWARQKPVGWAGGCMEAVVIQKSDFEFLFIEPKNCNWCSTLHPSWATINHCKHAPKAHL